MDGYALYIYYIIYNTVYFKYNNTVVLKIRISPGYTCITCNTPLGSAVIPLAVWKKTHINDNQFPIFFF